MPFFGIALVPISDHTKAIELEHAPLSWPYEARGRAYREQENYERALEEFNNRRAILYYRQENYEATIDDLSKAIELAPSIAIYYSHRGGMYEKIGDREKAIADYQQAIALDNDPRATEFAREHLDALGEQ